MLQRNFALKNKLENRELEHFALENKSENQELEHSRVELIPVK